MSKPIQNPYASKLNKESSASTVNQRRTREHPNSSSLPPVRVVATSFSQAFAEVDTSIAATSATETINTSSPPALDDQNLSDREHHVLLQPHVLYVSTRQRGNGILQYIRNVPYAFSRMVPDYIMSSTRCALFLSCKYHSLYPNYIHRRIAELKSDFTLRVLLVLVDVDDNANILLFLNKLAVTNNLSLILAWSEEEAARYLETFKAFDGKDASLIQKKESTHFPDQVADVLSGIVNRTDSANLLSQFSNLRAMVAASMDELALVPGMGQVKVKRFYDALHKPFSKKKQQQRKKARVEQEEELARENHTLEYGSKTAEE